MNEEKPKDEIVVINPKDELNIKKSDLLIILVCLVALGIALIWVIKQYNVLTVLYNDLLKNSQNCINLVELLR